MKHGFIFAALLMFAGVQSAQAGTIEWTDWTSWSYGAHGSASGTAGGIGISYTGDLMFGQTGTGTNYWSEGTPAPYTGSDVVDNAPTAAEMIAVRLAGTTNTITFSEAVTNPVMAIVSLGKPDVAVTWDFNVPFIVLSSGSGYSGDGTVYTSLGDLLTGNEFNGVIQFLGTFTSISWTSNVAETWQGFTIGLTSTEVPEPGTLALSLLALLCLGARRLRK